MDLVAHLGLPRKYRIRASGPRLTGYCPGDSLGKGTYLWENAPPDTEEFPCLT